MKINIIEYKQNSNKVFVNLFEENLNQEKINMEIYFIEISKLMKQYKNNLKGWKKYIELNQNDILVIGIKNKY